MKKTALLPVFAICLLAACSNHTKGTHEGESGPNLTNVENVNGNLADTSTGSSLNKKMTPDSSHLRDSMRK